MRHIHIIETKVLVLCVNDIKQATKDKLGRTGNQVFTTSIDLKASGGNIHLDKIYLQQSILQNCMYSLSLNT